MDNNNSLPVKTSFNKVQQNSLYRAARWYARNGWHVIPLHEPIFNNGRCTGCTCEQWRRENGKPDFVCDSPGKHPRLSKWEERATTDLNQIYKWWRAWPNANVGIATGRSGLVVIDHDKYKDMAGELPFATRVTVTSLTGGGGEHLFYLHPEGQKLGNGKGELPESVDVRAWGGFIVLPPSLHYSGNVYEWESGYGPHERKPTVLPQLLADTLHAAAIKPVEFGDPEKVNFEESEIPNWVKALMAGDRSRIDECVITALVKGGLTNNQILYLFQHHAPTEKYESKERHGDNYLARSIAHARAHINKPRQRSSL